jgi:hypothetical protein
MFAPQPAAEPVLAVVLHPVHHRNAVAKVEIAGPAAQHLVDLPNHLLDRTPLRPVVEDGPQLLAQVASALLAGLGVEITAAARLPAPRQVEAQEVDACLADVHRPGFHFSQLCLTELADVPSTPTPPERCEDAGGCPVFSRRPAPVKQRLGCSPVFNFSRLIRCGSLSLRPAGSSPSASNPAARRRG